MQAQSSETLSEREARIATAMQDYSETPIFPTAERDETFGPARCQVWKIIEADGDQGVLEIATNMDEMVDGNGERVGVHRVQGVWRDKYGHPVLERMQWALDAESERQQARDEIAILTGEIVVDSSPEVDVLDLMRAEDDGMIPVSRMAPHPLTEQHAQMVANNALMMRMDAERKARAVALGTEEGPAPHPFTDHPVAA